ncbi:MAG: hypothetical protein ACKVOW_15620 [Chitinophagaceae bacterium]
MMAIFPLGIEECLKPAVLAKTSILGFADLEPQLDTKKMLIKIVRRATNRFMILIKMSNKDRVFDYYVNRQFKK